MYFSSFITAIHEHKLVFSQDTEFEVYEVNVTEEDVKAVIEEEVN